MKALKLFLPLILAPVVAAVAFFVWWKFANYAPGAAGDAAYVFGAGPPALPAPTLANATDGARQAFDFSIPHDDVALEWWYFNAHLMDEQNHRYSLMMALLRTGQVFGSFTMVQHRKHFGVHDTGLVELRPALRSVIAPFNRLDQIEPGKFDYDFALDQPTARIKLRLKANKYPLPVGGQGVIDMGDAGRSAYFSLTNMAVTGAGSILGRAVKLAGKGWMDHQWGGWNDKEFDQWFWYSIQLADNTEIMIFEFRRHSKRLAPICDVVRPNGETLHGVEYTTRPLKNWVSPTTGRNWSVGWLVTFPALDAELKIIPDLDDQEVTKSLWEGSCKVDGRFEGKPAKGLAFYEARQRTW
jgi:predicted secreted hydrolase